MSLIKRKLGSKAGASMLLALVFLMFCLFIGGSVLAAATANGSRVAHLKNDQQDYLSQRSAMLLMADMLTGKDGEELQVVITDVVKTTPSATEGEAPTTTRTMTFTCPTPITGAPNILQKALFEIIVATYGSDEDITSVNCTALDITKPTATATNLQTGTISANVKIGSSEEVFTASYLVDPTDHSLTIDFGADTYVSLKMDGSIGESNEKKVTIGTVETKTTTTVIRWSQPVLEKRGA